MFKKILIANHGDQLARASAAAQPNCMAAERYIGDFGAESKNV